LPVQNNRPEATAEKKWSLARCYDARSQSDLIVRRCTVGQAIQQANAALAHAQSDMLDLTPGLKN